MLYRDLQGKGGAAQAQIEAATLQRCAADRATRAFRAGESGLTELLVARRSLADAVLAERLARVNVRRRTAGSSWICIACGISMTDLEQHLTCPMNR
ncbi:hypothetical protein [Arthrobacter methylotrophus]|uniref:hypothetical protein n=1 Tax=Arthrobacter methylotrophus TaxID=121291 RepID=UPI0031E672D6